MLHRGVAFAHFRQTDEFPQWRVCLVGQPLGVVACAH